MHLPSEVCQDCGSVVKSDLTDKNEPLYTIMNLFLEAES